MGGLVSFSVQDMGAGGYGKAAIGSDLAFKARLGPVAGGKSHRSSPYGQGSFQKGVQRLWTSVHHAAEGMPAMQQNGVVKAGAQGEGL